MRRQEAEPERARSRVRSLTALFDPRSVTVLGASDDPAKWGNVLAHRALESCGDRPVALVNRRGSRVLGRRTTDTLAAAAAELGGGLDLVVVCVPAGGVLDSVTEALEAGARSLVVITAGLSEVDGPGVLVEQEIVRLAREHDAVLVGPNCLGVVDTGARLQLSHDVMPAGDVAVLSQSGNLTLDLAALLADRGLGISRFVSVGNQADLSVVDLMASCVEHDDTRAVAVYVEDVVDGRAFIDAARALARAGKPLVVLAPGRSAAAVRSAVSHTGSLTSAARVVDAVCACVGAHRVDNPTEMADLLGGLGAGRRLAGRRVAVLTDGGGHGAIAADALSLVGLEVPVLAKPTGATLRSLLGPAATVANPVDLAGAGEQDPDNYARGVGALLADADVDGVLLTGYFGAYSVQQSSMAARELASAELMCTLVAAQPKPVVVQSIAPAGPTGVLLRAAGIPVHRDIDRAAAVLRGTMERPVAAEVPMPATATALTGSSYEEARELFASAGVRFPAARTVHDRDELAEAVAVLQPPLVLKALGRVHKSEGGGVVLGLVDASATLASYDEMVTQLAPPAVSVEEMVDTSQGVELLVGCVRDPRFGPMVMVGLGGVFAEALDDTAVAVAPVDAEHAQALLLGLRGAVLLAGARGRPPVGLGALADLVARVSQVAAAHPELGELELNPVLALPDGAIALDARVVLD